MKLEKISNLVLKTGQTLGSLIKVACMSKGVSSSRELGGKKEIVILGNGPSLRQTIDSRLDWLLCHDLMAVNFAAITQDFILLRPRYYLLADVHFFNSLDSDNNVRKLWEKLASVTWEMTLLVPSKFRHLVKPLVIDSENLKLRYFNLTPVEGFKAVNHSLFNLGLGMPRPRNVLIPAIMEAIRMGYNKIFLCGADHSWTKTLDVDDENFVISIQPHFYKDNDDERLRVREAYRNIKLHEVIGSMAIAFKSYWDIAEYAKKRKVEIINSTPGSMIDAFPREKRDGHSA